MRYTNRHFTYLLTYLRALVGLDIIAPMLYVPEIRLMTSRELTSGFDF